MKTTNKNVLKNQKGFTLIEMLLVVVIIGTLIVLVFPKANEVLKQTNETSCEAYQKSIDAQRATNILLGNDPDADLPSLSDFKACQSIPQE